MLGCAHCVVVVGTLMSVMWLWGAGFSLHQLSSDLELKGPAYQQQAVSCLWSIMLRSSAYFESFDFGK